MEYFIIGLMTFFFIAISIKLDAIIQDIAILNAHKKTTNARLRVIMDNEAEIISALQGLYEYLKENIEREEEMVDAMKEVANNIKEMK